MCLSTVYKNEMTPENVVLGNVMRINCENGCVTLIDIMGREAVVEGEIVSADLTGGTVVVGTKASCRSFAALRRFRKAVNTDAPPFRGIGICLNSTCKQKRTERQGSVWLFTRWFGRLKTSARAIKCGTYSLMRSKRMIRWRLCAHC